MSSTVPPEEAPPRPKHYAPGTGTDRYIRFAEDWLDVRLGHVQQEILRSLEENRRTIVVTANGVGKSHGGGACGGIAATYCNPDTTTNITSGSYGQLDDTIWKPIKSLHRKSQLPGRTLDNTRELRTGLDEEWYLKCLSPKYPADLEGRHNRRMIYIIEEADKPGITAEHIDSAESTLTDAGDRMLVIANPPEDESNVVYELMESPKWHTLQFSSFQSENVRAALNDDVDPIHGLVSLNEIRENWEDWNGENWPGVEEARNIHERRDDLDARWYRRRAGTMPPTGAGVYRPYTAAGAKDAFRDREATNYFGDADSANRPVGTGIDVAGPGSDKTIMVTLFRNGDLDVRYTTKSTDYPDQEQELMHDSRLGGDKSHPVAVDANGEGSGLASYLDDRLPDLYRFGSDKNPLTEGKGDEEFGELNYKNQRTEALAALGKALPEVRYVDTDLREELVIGGRTIEFDTTTVQSRGNNGAEVAVANSKDAIEDRLGHSPDILDAAMMAVWAAECTDQDLSPDDIVVL